MKVFGWDAELQKLRLNFRNSVLMSVRELRRTMLMVCSFTTLFKM